MSDEEKNEERRRESFLRDFFENSELYTFGIITQKGYRELEERLSEHAKSVSARFHRWFVLGLTAFSIIALSSAVGLIGFGLLLKQQKKTTTEIQRQRTAFVLTSCKDQNHRHDRTIHRLVKAADDELKMIHSEKRRIRIHNSVGVSIGLIDALAPKRNCERVAREATGK